MRRIVFKVRFLGLIGIAVIAGVWPVAAQAAPASLPPLGTAANFGALAGATITNTGPSVVTGLLGVSPGSAVTGFPPGISGALHLADAVAATAQNDLTVAYNNAAGQQCLPANNFNTVGLGGKTLHPGVYCQATAPTLSGTLTLDGAGVYIFQTGSTLVTAAGAPGMPGATVTLINGASPCQVFWQVGSSATIDTYTNFAGTIMAQASISMNTGATLNGRALARIGAVTLQTNTITGPSACGNGNPAACDQDEDNDDSADSAEAGREGSGRHHDNVPGDSEACDTDDTTQGDKTDGDKTDGDKAEANHELGRTPVKSVHRSGKVERKSISQLNSDR